MSSKDMHMKLEERAEASTTSQNKSNPEKLRGQRSWDNIMREAYLMNKKTESQRLSNEPLERTRQEILPKIQELNKELEDRYTSHPEQQHSPSRTKKAFRVLTYRDKNPRAKRLGTLTEEITTSMTEILNTLGHEIPQTGKKPALTSEQLEDIHCLVKFAVAQSEKATRKRKDDTRSTDQMDHELEQYRDLAARIGKWAKFLKEGGDAPELIPPELRREYEIPSLEATYEVAWPLLKSFKGYFPEAGKLIQECVPAMQLIAEATKVGGSFGGYAEEGPRRDMRRGYTIDRQVYVPKARTDPVSAIRTFLFELTNSIHSSKFRAMDYAVFRGGEITAKEYARGYAQQELEGCLRLAEVWIQIKSQMKEV